jgi:signal transduction histidine kinase
VLDNPELHTDERERFLQTMVQETERLTRLINQVLDLAKLESGRAEWHVGDVDTREVVHAAVAATGQLLRDRDAQIEVDLPDPMPPVAADRDRLMQVLLNLLSNAAKFCDPSAGRIDVRVAVRPDAVQLDVSDNGPGIAPEQQKVIFEKFRQAGDTLTDKPQGTGLGLPISREIVTRLGGKIWVDSAPGKGTTFSFTLPRAVGGGEPRDGAAGHDRKATRP